MTIQQKDTELKSSENFKFPKQDILLKDRRVIILKLLAFLFFLAAIVIGAKYGITKQVWILFAVGLILFISSIILRIWTYKKLFKMKGLFIRP